MPILLSPYSSDLAWTSNVSSISSMSPVSPVSVTLLPPVFKTTLVLNPVYPLIGTIDVDTGLNDNYIAQRQMTKELLYRFLDKQLFEDDYKSLLKYFKVHDGTVKLVSNKKEYSDNDISKNSESDLEKKADYIEDKFLDLESMRTILRKIVDGVGIKWFNLLQHEYKVYDAVKIHLKHVIENKLK